MAKVQVLCSQTMNDFNFQFLVFNSDFFSLPSWWDELDIIVMNVAWYYQRYYDSNLHSLEHEETYDQSFTGYFQ